MKDVQEALKTRYLHGNIGANARKYDTREKLFVNIVSSIYKVCRKK